MRSLPSDDFLRTVLHNEVHSRPAARVRLPALITYVAVLNADVSREQEHQQLRALPGQQDLPLDSMLENFLRLRFDHFTVKWERHTEFTRYSIVQTLPEHAGLGFQEPDLLSAMAVAPEWLKNIPGRTMAAVQLAMVHGDTSSPSSFMEQARAWFGGSIVVASGLGYESGYATLHGEKHGDACTLTDFRIRSNGFERMLVIAQHGIGEKRTGRISQRLLELETYRLMALRALPIAKQLGPSLSKSEQALASIAARLEHKAASDQDLLDALVSLAAQVERTTAENIYRFSATRAYHTLVSERIVELREKSMSGSQTIGEFMQRRLSPAMATVTATAQRLSSLSERISRTSALLRTRVDIATEAQNQQLLEKLTRGQALQLRLQTTVEGLSIAAISYYVVSLLIYCGKALKVMGVPLNPELAAGLFVPVVLWGVWCTTRRIHAKFHAEPHSP